ncbi:MAG: shikimate kinase [Bacteroidaceae bacterium]|jgi:shikimate kinase|nr:shikimate kinase [Bacteroidaceae bacterium]
MVRVFLMGFMGAGKTTLGKALAAHLGVSFIDLDQYIESRFMKSVSQIFATRGEQGFREIESRLLREVGEFDNVIVSCGGSTPLIGDNMDYMLSQGQTVYLKCSNETLLSRLKTARSQRPLIASKTDDELALFIESETKRREPGYLRARYICPGDRLESRDQIAETIEYIENLLNLNKD